MSGAERLREISRPLVKETAPLISARTPLSRRVAWVETERLGTPALENFATDIRPSFSSIRATGEKCRYVSRPTTTRFLLPPPFLSSFFFQPHHSTRERTERLLAPLPRKKHNWNGKRDRDIRPTMRDSRLF